MGRGALFEDIHTDIRMRRTIPRFGLLGALGAAVTAPFTAPDGRAVAGLLGLAAVALAVSFAVTWRDAIDWVPQGAVWAILVSYCVLIALAIAATGDPASPYQLLFLLPVMFTATFFTGWVRYSMALFTPLLAYLLAGIWLPTSAKTLAVSAVMYLLVAHFGAVVADTLREALRVQKSLHTVLEASTGSPLDDDLARIGLDAALSVSGWSAGAVLFVQGPALVPAAAAGLEPGARRRYDDAGVGVDDGAIVALAVHADDLVYVADIGAEFGRDYFLAKEGMTSVVALGLRYHGEVLAVLALFDRRYRRLDPRGADRLRHVAGQLGLALGSAAAYRRELEVADSLRELNRRKDEFLANVSHELRTPAATLKLIAVTLRRSSHLLAPQQVEEMYGTLERRAQHLSDLIQDLLDEAVADAGETRLAIGPIDWCAALAAWAEQAEQQYGRPVTLVVPDQAIRGTGDAVKLERVVANLLSNAAKFSPPGTPIELALRAEGDWVHVEVTDAGVGITPGELDRVFDRFHQVDAGLTRPAGGFGIGLSLTRHFVEAHGGTITVRSAPGKGSTFGVHLPRLAGVGVRHDPVAPLS